VEHSQSEGGYPMKNLAGDSRADNTIRQELRRARIPMKDTPLGRTEVPFTVIGRLGAWTFKRAWYYWMAHAEYGKGLPEEKAEALNTRWREEVRVQGYAGGTDVAQWLTGAGTIDTYHIDTQEGLNAFAKAIR
jgi:hypothetical protein